MPCCSKLAGRRSKLKARFAFAFGRSLATLGLNQVDVASDWFVSYQYWQQGDTMWAIVGGGCIVLSGVLAVPFHWFSPESEETSIRRKFMMSFLSLFQLHMCVESGECMYAMVGNIRGKLKGLKDDGDESSQNLEENITKFIFGDIEVTSLEKCAETAAFRDLLLEQLKELWQLDLLTKDQEEYLQKLNSMEEREESMSEEYDERKKRREDRRKKLLASDHFKLAEEKVEKAEESEDLQGTYYGDAIRMSIVYDAGGNVRGIGSRAGALLSISGSGSSKRNLDLRVNFGEDDGEMDIVELEWNGEFYEGGRVVLYQASRLYLPKQVLGVAVLLKDEQGKWRADFSALRTADGLTGDLKRGLPYKAWKSPDAEAGSEFLRWGETVEGVDVGDGWVQAEKRAGDAATLSSEAELRVGVCLSRVAIKKKREMTVMMKVMESVSESLPQGSFQTYVLLYMYYIRNQDITSLQVASASISVLSISLALTEAARWPNRDNPEKAVRIRHAVKAFVLFFLDSALRILSLALFVAQLEFRPYSFIVLGGIVVLSSMDVLVTFGFAGRGNGTISWPRYHDLPYDLQEFKDHTVRQQICIAAVYGCCLGPAGFILIIILGLGIGLFLVLTHAPLLYGLIKDTGPDKEILSPLLVRAWVHRCFDFGGLTGLSLMNRWKISDEKPVVTLVCCSVVFLAWLLLSANFLLDPFLGYSEDNFWFHDCYCRCRCRRRTERRIVPQANDDVEEQEDQNARGSVSTSTSRDLDEKAAGFEGIHFGDNDKVIKGNSLYVDGTSFHSNGRWAGSTFATSWGEEETWIARASGDGKFILTCLLKVPYADVTDSEIARADPTFKESIKARPFYLPKVIADKTVLFLRTENIWYADKRELGGDSPGLGYRTAKILDARAGDDASLKWGETIEGVDEGDGWIRVLRKANSDETEATLPSPLNPDSVLPRQQEMKAILPGSAEELEDLVQEAENAEDERCRDEEDLEELSKKTLRELKRLAKIEGASDEDVDGFDEEENPKKSAIQWIQSKKAQQHPVYKRETTTLIVKNVSDGDA